MTDQHNARVDVPVEFRLMNVKDKPEVLALMLQSRFPISGLISRSMYSALCGDALIRSDVQIAVAIVENQTAAFLVTITDWTRYWKHFLLRRPLLGVRILVNRLNKSGKAVDVWPQLPESDKEYVQSIISENPSNRNWSDSSRTIAKGVFLQVDPKFRGRRLSVGLYHYLMDYLASCGVTRIDARVDLTNRRAMPLHVSVGYQLERAGNSLFATKDLKIQASA